MKSGHSIWATHRVASEVIELDGLFENYWSSKDHEFTVSRQSSSPAGPRRSDCEEQRPLSLENILGLWKSNSLQMIPFVFLPLPIPTS